ncbi:MULTISPECIES: DEAD/DEAH box helicase [unclassified Streptomyces]|uniref:DEAD/DEAH box helicase n=1 Tax=unclassified Streptomyces TaxID=2593676 RepID=UPI002DD852D0|nr:MULTISPECIES: Helicase associated domain protein [unclassified Streptomyces]WSF81727.1 Helicase associated domain protein [Streptomyces sp. NBC_01744]WSC41962.1 Helicase associated domain protein [Streptomyces sp. NBC_01763]WSC50894.1 Helicase associated domain protein [Streptomyces sp. NBC_01761]WSC58627.1 Helicase associated domain protein [Streptomyces sp. NBC_01761]WSF89738.1 Helicase associated domain protein [Streptomyces sp. NBC_01744]
MIQLREHQVEANSGIRKWVGFPARSSIPAQGARATLVSATGSGKTITAASAALDNFPGGRILVTVPTLDLLVQTAQAWRRVGHRSPMVAVCSLEKDDVLEQLGVRTTTNPIQLALWAGHGPVIVFATYASLVDRDDPEDPMGQRKVRGPLEAALAGGERLYGQTTEPFDLAVVDEAHGTTGDLGRPWAAIHENQRIPADFRLYLTATPRILAAPRPQKGKDGQELEIASMRSDPAGTYGEWIFELGLSEAIERSILAGFEIDVIEIRDPEPVLGLSEEALRGRRLALLQTALLEHAAAHNLHTVMTFHQRVEEAAAFAEKLPETAAELYATEASDRFLEDAAALPPSSISAKLYDLEPYRHVPPDRVWAQWLCGDHLVSERREVLRQFANGINAQNKRVHRAFLASVRVLGEGVDIVGTRGVEAICFADTRGSQVEIVQNIGRALRPNPDGTTKVARIIVPVFLQPGEDPDDMIASASFAPLVAVLNGLRSHDERLVEQLASRAHTSGQRKVHIQRDEEGRIIGTEGKGEGEAVDQENETPVLESALLHFSTPRDPATIAAFLRTRIYRPESLIWLEGYQALRRWRTENHITGLHAIPYDTATTVGVTTDFPLGRWVHQQRKALRAGELEERRKKLLDSPEAGMVWEPGEEAWETKLAMLRSYQRAHGHLAPRQDTVWGDAEGELVPVGQHMANLRRKGGLGKNPERAEKRAAQLTAVDEDWCCPWPLDWQRHYAVLRDLAETEPGGNLPEIQPGVLFEGDDLGRWIERQARDWVQLAEEQRERLTALGVKPTERPSPAPAAKAAAKGSGKASAAFQRGVAALAQYIAREGHHRVPRAHLEPILVEGGEHELKLGIWYTNQKQRRHTLTQEQRATLTELGIDWAQ